MIRLLVTLALIGCLTSAQDAMEHLSHINTTQLLKTILDLMTDDELDLIDTVTANTSIYDLYNLSQWQDLETEGLEAWDAIYSVAESMCDELQLESPDCYNDCLYYNFIPNWIPLIMSNDTEDMAQIMELISWYSVSAGPNRYNDAGNVDMCQYFEGTYCYTPAGFSGFTANQHGCCVPGTCTGSDAEKVLSANSWCYGSFESFSAFQGQEVTMTCDPMERDMKATDGWTTIVIFFLFFGCIVIASVLKRYCVQFRKVDPKEVDSNPFIKLFNIQSIWSAFGQKRKKEHSATNFIDGFKVFSMTWVLIGHLFMIYLMMSSNTVTIGYTAMSDNKDYHYKAQDFYTILLQYATYSMDTFFFFSGLLGTWSIYRFIKKIGDRPLIYIPMSYLARFLRLAPMMMFVTLIYMTLLDQLPYGYKVTSRTAAFETCSDVWYKILFFYANLSEDSILECMGHLWFLQVDMQMFLLLPFLMWIFTKSKIWGIVSSFILIIVCLIIRFVYGFYYEFTANTFIPAYQPANGGNYTGDSYIKPWAWLSCYFLAVALAMWMITIDEKKKPFVLRAWQYWSCMLMAAFIMMSLMFWPYQDVKDLPDGRWGKTSNSMYYALGGQGGPAWSAGLALMTIAFKYMDEDTENNGNGQKSMVKAFLSLEIWQPLNKLCFVMYLIHGLIQFHFALDTETTLYYDEWSFVLNSFGFWCLAALVGLILWFVMEKPLANMATMFIAWILGFGQKRSSNAKYEAVGEQKHAEVDKVESGIHSPNEKETVELSEIKEHSPVLTLNVNRA